MHTANSPPASLSFVEVLSILLKVLAAILNSEAPGLKSSKLQFLKEKKWT